MVIQRLKRQVLTQVTSDRKRVHSLLRATARAGPGSEAEEWSSYFRASITAEQSREVSVAMATSRRASVCIFPKLIDELSGASGHGGEVTSPCC